ncbi:LytR/AlgR family response regulator transcription factor [Undibacterium sp. Ren11W]|uniref:LytR/AlgR family response regulator transcription factor n=1 Tax=Undibacterium sp. Ren11W TaxID=3413045 RepID=UPI003BF301FF
MNLPKILIVDDEAPARQRLAMLLSDIQTECPCVLIGEAANAQAALDSIAVGRPDIILLDVQMPGMNGLELAQHLARNSQTQQPAVIFITAYDEYALKAFEVHAMDYLLKPVRASRLAEAILRIVRLRIAGSSPVELKSEMAPVILPKLPTARQCFSVLERNRILLVPVADVLFLKAEQKYVTLHTKARSYLLEESLTSIEEEMVISLVRVHRNALVSRLAIVGVERAPHSNDPEHDHEKLTESWQVILRDCDERLPISRRQWPVIKALVR